VVAGCMPSRYGADLEESLTEVDSFVSCAAEDNIVGILDALFGCVPEVPAQDSGEVVAHAMEALPESSAVSAYIKIAEGCNRNCSFCTIPSIRGDFHSFAFADLLAEADALVASGVRELNLIAQDTGRWGAELDDKPDLADLMAAIAERYPHVWVRVLYVQPEGVTDKLIATMKAHDNICSYLDIPFQHSQDKLLRAMNRPGTRNSYLALVDHLRQEIPDIVLRTTFIAGFPGESEDDFEALCDFVEEIDFDYAGVFAYSPEEGTPAAEMEEQIEEELRIERANQLTEIAHSLSFPHFQNFVGKTLPVLVEGQEEDGQWFGRLQAQAPEVDGLVFIHFDEGSEIAPGDIVQVKIEDSLYYDLEGNVVN